MKIASAMIFLLVFSAAQAFAVQGAVPKPAAQTAPAKKPATTATRPAAQYITTASGLKYRDIVVGKGAEAKTGDRVACNYVGRFTNGKIFDSSAGRGPYEFTLGRGEVIKGWDEGVTGMRVGGKRRLIVPPNLAYGSQGMAGIIPPNSTLTFVVELVKIK
jgi:FKBP-type peptidyl-prolyl cis-trans isomerase